MTELEIYQAIESSKTNEWQSPSNYITDDNVKILSVAMENF